MREKDLLIILKELYKAKKSVGMAFAESYALNDDSRDNEISISYFGEVDALITVIKLIENEDFRNQIIKDYKIELED